jgi:drug/metabolite transporter (DMT)-like permease
MAEYGYKGALARLHWIVFIWGFTAILGKLITLTAVPLVWWRVLIAGIGVGAWLWWKKIPFRLRFRDVLLLVGAGLIIALHWITFYHAIKISNISVTLACFSSGAFFVSLIEPIWHKRKPVWYEMLLGLLSMAGLGLIFKVETQYSAGIFTALFSAFLSAFFSVVNGQLSKRLPPEQISFYELWGGWGGISLFLLFTGGFSIDFFRLSNSDTLWLLLLGTVCTAYAFITSVQLLKHLSPYTMVLTINLEPVYGIILAYFIFGQSEHMSPAFYGGAGIILLTLFGNAWLKQRLSRKAAAKAA